MAQNIVLEQADFDFIMPIVFFFILIIVGAYKIWVDK